MKEVLDAVKIAEGKAQTIVADAEKEARDLIAQAESAGEKHLEEAKRISDLEGKDLVENARSEAERQSENLSKDYEERVVILKRQAAKKMPLAVDLIVERIVKAHGDS